MRFEVQVRCPEDFLHQPLAYSPPNTHAIASLITYRKHADIDKGRWDALIEKAGAKGLIYARSEMLDAMSPGWDALVSGDYEAVMPLTWRKKMGIRYLCQPAFCQQLGVFSDREVTAQMVEAFLVKASVHFRLAEIFLNFSNRVEQAAQTATNFILPLERGYNPTREHYKNDLLKNLARAAKYEMAYLPTENVSLAIDHFETLYGRQMGLRKTDYAQLKLLCENWVKQGRCLVRQVHFAGRGKDELLAIGLFLKDGNRIYNIASSTLPNGRTFEANHFLFDQLIREFAGQNLVLDFEGSDLPGVARFYQKFGPINQPFYFWKSNRLPAVLKWWKR